MPFKDHPTDPTKVIYVAHKYELEPRLKKLTNNEIEVLWEKHCPFDLTAGIKFARAILRKASEK